MNDIRKGSLPDEEAQNPVQGSTRPRLVWLLHRKADERGQTRHELARELGITYYLQ